jgi:hypothetical protein
MQFPRRKSLAKAQSTQNQSTATAWCKSVFDHQAVARNVKTVAAY